MPADRLGDPATALREAARAPQAPVDPERVLARARALRRRRAGWTAAAVVALLVPLATLALVSPGAVVRFADGARPEQARVEASLAPAGSPPSTLADGTPTGTVPDAVAARFPGPVVAARRDADLAARPPEPCTRVPLAGARDEAVAGVGARLEALARSAEPVAAHIGPAIATTLAVGRDQAPPAYTGLLAAVCIARHDGSGWQSQGLGVDHLYEGWTAGSYLGDGGIAPRSVQVTALAVPPGAAWAVQEQPGWWLAYGVGGDGWVLAHVAGGGERFAATRVVFVDAAGQVVEDRSTGPRAIPPDAPPFRPQVADATVEVGRASQVRARLAGDQDPLPVCAEEHGVCVWLVDLDGELVALAAAGPHPLDVPPLGAVGYCPGEGTFQSLSTRSVFDRAGRLVDGPAPAGLHRYEVVESGGTVLIDLAAFAFGPEAHQDHAEAGAARCDVPVEPGG